MEINIVNNSKHALPKYAKLNDAGMDLRADFDYDWLASKDLYKSYYNNRDHFYLLPGERILIPTNIHIQLPVGYEAQIRPRSGLALNFGITVLNTPGTIDAGYTNSIGVILFNTSKNTFKITDGDRIAQMVINKFETVQWNEVTELNKTERNDKGFGHTGNK